jgi:hypothetical protein
LLILIPGFCEIYFFLCLQYVPKCVLSCLSLNNAYSNPIIWMYSYFSATLTEVFPCFSSVVRQMPGYNSPRRGTVRTLQNFCVVLCIVCFVLFCVFFVCKCVLYYCHRLATQLLLTNIPIKDFNLIFCVGALELFWGRRDCTPGVATKLIWCNWSFFQEISEFCEAI